MKPPFAHRVKKPFRYVPSEATDIAVTIRRARAAIEATRQHAANVRPIKKLKEAA